MATLSAAIMAHPDRADLVSELTGSLDREVPVSWDDKPVSRHTEQRWAVGRAAWLSYDPDADFHLVLQDDAIVVPDLLAGLESALDHVPDQVLVSPFIGTKRPAANRWNALTHRAIRDGASWVESTILMWGVAIIARTSMIDDMVAWADNRVGKPYDTRVGQFWVRNQINTWYTWPCLVDHRDGPSLVGHGAKGRNAQLLHTGSALDLDFSGPVVRDNRVSRQRGTVRSRPSRKVEQ